MNILCVIEAGTWVEHHIVGSLAEMGHSVHVYRYGSAIGEFYPWTCRKERERKNRSLLGMARDLYRAKGIDLIFCYVYDDFLLPDTARALSRLNVPLVNYNVDMATQWYRQVRTARYFDRMLCAEPVNMHLLARYNPRVLHFPMAARYSVPAEGEETAFQPGAPVTFVGSQMTFRAALLSRLHDAGVPIAVYGRNWVEGLRTSAPAGLEKTLRDICSYTWPKLRAEGTAGLAKALRRRFSPGPTGVTAMLPTDILRGFVTDTDMHTLFAGSEINLGLTRTSGEDLNVRGTYMIKLRDFEVPMAGGFYLVERAPGLEQFFRFGVEVETWETPEELLEKVRYYLDHREQRRLIAAAGAERAKRDHTWKNRFEALFADLGIGSIGDIS